MNQDQKSIFRVIFNFTEEKYKNTPPSNMFYRSLTKEYALEFCIKAFEDELKKNGFVGAKYKVEIFNSSIEEVDLYRKNGVRSVS